MIRWIWTGSVVCVVRIRYRTIDSWSGETGGLSGLRSRTALRLQRRSAVVNLVRDW